MSLKEFSKEIIDPFLQHKEKVSPLVYVELIVFVAASPALILCTNSSVFLQAFDCVVALLTGIVVRHSKENLKLFEPQRSSVRLAPLKDASRPYDDTAAIDNAKAMHISQCLIAARNQWRESKKHNSGDQRKPKFIVFAEDYHVWQGVAHYLTLQNGALNCIKKTLRLYPKQTQN